MTGTINLAQLPNQAIKVTSKLTVGASETEYTFSIFSNGDIDGADCGKTDPSIQLGEEFRPLKEVKQGVENPYADSSRGRIDKVTIGSGLTEAVLD